MCFNGEICKVQKKNGDKQKLSTHKARNKYEGYDLYPQVSSKQSVETFSKT